MKKRLIQLSGILGLSFILMLTLELTNQNGERDLLLTSVISSGFSQQKLPDVCGPLMGNTSGTKYCCANINATECLAATCGGVSNA